MKNTKPQPQKEIVEKLPKNASFVENNNKYANTFINFKEPEILEYFTVTGKNANNPNKIIKETFLQKHN